MSSRTAISTELRVIVAAAAVFLGALGVLVAVGGPVDAQEVSCRDVPYNERIVIVCTTSGDVVAASPTPSPTPTPDPSPTPTDEDDDEGDEDNGDRIGVGDNDRIDRGDRGARVGADLPDGEFDSDADAGDADEADDDEDDGDALEAGDVDDGEPPDDYAAAVAGRGDDEARATDSVPDGEFIGTVDPEPDARPVVVGLISVLGVGSAFFVAAWRTSRNTDPF